MQSFSTSPASSTRFGGCGAEERSDSLPGWKTTCWCASGSQPFGAPLKSAEPELTALSAREVPKQAETLPVRFGAVGFPWFLQGRSCFLPTPQMGWEEQWRRRWLFCPFSYICRAKVSGNSHILFFFQCKVKQSLIKIIISSFWQCFL